MWVWDLATHAVAHRLDIPATDTTGGVGNVEFVDELTVVVSGDESAVFVTLDAETLRGLAASRVTRTFTDRESATYQIEQCSARDQIPPGGS